MVKLTQKKKEWRRALAIELEGGQFGLHYALQAFGVLKVIPRLNSPIAREEYLEKAMDLLSALTEEYQIPKTTIEQIVTAWAKLLADKVRQKYEDQLYHGFSDPNAKQNAKAIQMKKDLKRGWDGCRQAHDMWLWQVQCGIGQPKLPFEIVCPGGAKEHSFVSFSGQSPLPLVGTAEEVDQAIAQRVCLNQKQASIEAPTVYYPGLHLRALSNYALARYGEPGRKCLEMLTNIPWHLEQQTIADDLRKRSRKDKGRPKNLSVAEIAIRLNNAGVDHFSISQIINFVEMRKRFDFTGKTGEKLLARQALSKWLRGLGKGKMAALLPEIKKQKKKNPKNIN